MQCNAIQIKSINITIITYIICKDDDIHDPYIQENPSLSIQRFNEKKEKKEKTIAEIYFGNTINLQKQ